MSEKSLETVKKLLKRHDQIHLLTFWQQLNDSQKQELLAQIEQLDFEKIGDWIERFVKNPSPYVKDTDFAPAPVYSSQPKDPQQQQKYDSAVKLGKELISAGKVSAFVVAGGQGTRLGFDGPKGDFHITPVKNKTLFHLFAEYIAAAQAKYHTTLPWYIMTSPLNHTQTIEIFRSNDYYSLDQNNIFIFQQGTLPNFDFDGKILLADKSKIACSPDGHGGSLKALYKSGAVEDMKKRGVEFISYFQVDNPLIKIFDPLFIGLHALDNAEMSSKAIIKTGPKEKVGNFCLADGKVTIIEYSDLPDELAEKKKPDGSLIFNLGNPAIHLISTTFIEKLSAKGFSLPIHRAVKKIPYVDQNASPIEPDQPNGVKLETFIFDAIPLASKSIVLETIRAEEFGPVKNAAGTDSADTAKAMMTARAANWLESAGVKIPLKPDGSPDATIEIAPAFALEKDDLKQKLNQIPQINPADNIYLT